MLAFSCIPATANLTHAHTTGASAPFASSFTLESAFDSTARSVVSVLNTNGDTTGSGILFVRCSTGQLGIATRRESLQSPIVGTPTPVFLEDGMQMDAYVAGTDPVYGLAALLLADQLAKTAKPVDLQLTKVPNAPHVGQTVLAVGREREEAFVSGGIVSAPARDLDGIGAPTNAGGALQCDCKWHSPASAGGALVTTSGRCIGMLASTYGSVESKRSGTSGVTFAQPTELLLARVPRLLAYGEPGR